MLLLTEHRPIGYITLFIAPILMVLSIWFWVDLNEELIDYPKFRALPLTIKIWRWSLTFYGIISILIYSVSINCLSIAQGSECSSWNKLPTYILAIIAKIFGFLFGTNWTDALASFFGYIFLITYVVVFLQWILIKLPKNGRIAGNF